MPSESVTTTFTNFITTHGDKANFVTSSHGNKMLILSGYKFCFQRCVRGKSRWLCSSHNGKGCKASVYTWDDIIIKANNDHYHAPVVTRIQGKYNN